MSLQKRMGDADAMQNEGRATESNATASTTTTAVYSGE